MKLFLPYLAMVLAALGSSTAQDESYKVLKFESTTKDYVSFKPSMASFGRAFSLCSWIRKLVDGSERTWFSYAASNAEHNELWLTDDGSYNRMFHKYDTGLRSQAGVKKGEWYHYCLCWDATSKTAEFYYNGKKTGSGTGTGSDRLYTNGHVVLGQDQDTIGGSFVATQAFGGELQKLNMYSKKLSAAEVSQMYLAGRCSDTVEKSHSSRQLKWEDILKMPRSGKVYVVDSCGVEKLKKLEKELAAAEAKLKKTELELTGAKTSSAKLGTELKDTVANLGAMTSEMKKLEGALKDKGDLIDKVEADLVKAETKLSDTDKKLAETKKKLADTSSSLKNTEALLYVSSFYNKVVTDEILISHDFDWDKLGEYVDGISTW